MSGSIFSFLARTRHYSLFQVAQQEPPDKEWPLNPPPTQPPIQVFRHSILLHVQFQFKKFIYCYFMYKFKLYIDGSLIVPRKSNDT